MAARAMKRLVRVATALVVVLAVAAGLVFYVRGRKPAAPRFETVRVDPMRN